MNKPSLVVNIDRIASNGCGVARSSNGRVIFVPWVLPCEKVEVIIKKKLRDYDEASLVRIIEASSERINPECPYYQSCGGCSLQHMKYSAQLFWKKEFVVDALKRIAGISDFSVDDVMAPNKTWHYRNRIKLHRDKKNNIGFCKYQSHDVVSIVACSIADQGINQMIADGKASQFFEGQPKKVTEYELRLGANDGFTQVNQEQNEVMKKLVVEFLAPEQNKNYVDLYCGSGNFTFPIAALAGKVWGIESDAAAIDQARSASKATNIRWMQTDTASGLLSLKNEEISIHGAVLDPPRQGIAEGMLGLLNMNFEKIVYVSCDPATFARDAKKLFNAGYALKKCTPLDMFPQTNHVELVSLFEKQ